MEKYFFLSHGHVYLHVIKKNKPLADIISYFITGPLIYVHDSILAPWSIHVNFKPQLRELTPTKNPHTEDASTLLNQKGVIFVSGQNKMISARNTEEN